MNVSLQNIDKVSAELTVKLEKAEIGRASCRERVFDCV